MSNNKSKYKRNLIIIIAMLVVSSVGFTSLALSNKIQKEKQQKIEAEKKHQQQLQAEKAEKEAKEKAEKEAKEKAAKEEARKQQLAKEKAKKEAAARAAKEAAQKKAEKERQQALMQSKILDVPTINQYQYGLANGCEAMSALMAVEYKTGQKINPYKFAMNIPKDPTPVQTSGGYNGITKWGSPTVGFVGDITGKNLGSTIYPRPLTRYLNALGYNAVDITGSSIAQIENKLKIGDPVVAWVSIDMSANHPYNHWATPYGFNARVTLYAHTVTLTGVDSNYFYYNDPINGSKNQKISKQQFANVYEWRGEKALVIQ